MSRALWLFFTATVILRIYPSCEGGQLSYLLGGFDRKVLTTRDNVRELLETRWERLGYDQLLQIEKDYLLIWWLQAESSNGTLHQYFYNSTGDYALDTLAALRRVGAVQAHTVLAKAISAFGLTDYPTAQIDRIKLLDSIPDQYKVFQKLTDELFEQSANSEDVITLAMDRVVGAYNDQGIDASDYTQVSPIRWAAIVILALIVFASAIGLMMVINCT